MPHNTTTLRSFFWITLVSIILLASAYPTISEAKLGDLFKPLSFTGEPQGIKPQRSFADERRGTTTARAPALAFAQPSSTSFISYPLSKGIAGYSDLFGFLGVANVATPGVRAVRVVGNTLTAGQQGTVSIEFDSQGDENAVGFSINFDRSKLTYVKTTKGADALAAGATLNTNPNQATALPLGHLGYALAVDAGTTFTAGTLQLVVVTFNVAASGNGTSDITFGDSPIPHEITDDGHTGSILILPADYTPGTVSINALAPNVTSLNPVSAVTGAPAFTLTVNGIGFATSSVVRINGGNRPTTFINTTQLTAQINAADIQASGSFPIDVGTPAPGGGISAAINLEVGNPVPVLTSIDPLSATAGAGAFTLTVNGSNFIGASVVKVNGSNRTTTFISGSQLTAEIPASDIQTAGTASVLVFNPTPAGGSSSPAGLTINNPLPVLGSIAPATAIVGGASFTLDVNGSNFVNGSAVKFNGSDCVTSFISSSQLTAQVTAADIQSTGTFSITVFNPAPGGGTSLAVDLAVNNPLPVPTSLSPASAIVGGGPFTLTVNGSSFVNGAVVRFNGSDRATTFGSNTQLTAEITAADIQATGTSLITVFNPTPGGGASGAVDFNVNNPVPVLASIAPATKLAGDDAFTLTVTGTNFVNGAVVRLNGSDCATTFVDATQLTTQVNAADVQSAGAIAVTVFNPTPGGGASGAVDLNVSNPVPTLASLSQTSATLGDAGFTVTVTGSNFVNGATVRFNGGDLVTNFISVTQLTAQITSANLSVAGIVPILVFNPLPGGGISAALDFTVNNPTPNITALSPASALAGGDALTLTVAGTNFVNGAVVRLNGGDRTTSFVNATQLTAQVTAADIATAGTLAITVFNPAPGGGPSAVANLAINNPIPVLSSLSPASAIVGGAAFTLTVDGSSFVNGAVVKFNGLECPTAFVSSTQLTAEITAADIQATGTSPITVFNPTPGGGASGAVDFNVNNPVPVLGSIAPASKLTGDDAFTLSVTGTSFVNGAVVRLNSSDRATTFVDATHLTAQVSAADLQSAGTIAVTVFNQLPGGGTSGAVDLNVSNPAPVLVSTTPVSATIGGAAFTLTVNGSSFVNGSVVKFNDSDRTTTFVSSTQLTAGLTAADLTQAGAFPVTVFNPAPAGGTSTAVDFTVNNTQPVVSGVSPANITVGGAAFSLTIDGTGFVSGSLVRLGGGDRTTVFVSTTQLTAQITAADIQATGTFAITVFNPTPGGGTSAAVDLHVNNPVPVLASLSPANKAAGGDAFTLTVTGTDFVSGAVVRLNGNSRPTTFVSTTQLTAEISVANISTVGALAVTVLNPAPGGGISNSLNLTVDPPAPDARALRLVNVTTPPGSTVNLSIELVSQGNENSLGFSLNFDPTQLVFVSATQGADATNASLVVNGGAATDHVGIAEVLPAGTAFSTGVHPAVTVTFSVPATGNLPSTEVKFDDFPVLREVVNTDASSFLPTAYSSGMVTVVQGYEANVSPRPDGNIDGKCPVNQDTGLPVGHFPDCLVTATDFTQVGLFIAHLDETSNVGNEFQRADCAPRSTKGDGRLSVADWTQSGRYAAGLDPVVFAGGPTGPTAQLPSAIAQLPSATAASIANVDQETVASVVRLATGQFRAGQTSSVSVELDAQGNENALGFSLMFNPATMSFISAEKGSDASDAALQVNKVNSSKGRVGIALAMPAERAFDAGRHQVVTVTFAVRSDVDDAAAPVFSDLPIDREVVDLRATPIKADFVKEKADEKNPIDDAQFFVTQHYQDFLSRKPDLGGLDYWTEQIAQCGTDAACVRDRRIRVSAAFFVEQEFQQTGSVVYRLYKAAYGQRPTYAEFSADRSQLVGGDQLPASTLEFANRFVSGAEFKQAYPDSLSPTAFINKLYEKAGLSQHASEKLQAVQEMSAQSKTRAQVLLELIETREFKDREYNSAFVLMQYFGYLQREADQDGYDFWLNVLNNREPGNYRGMVCAFITSQEYQHRFGSAVTHTNSECGR